MEPGRTALAQLHDTAFLYLVLVYGPDKPIPVAARRALADAMRRWYPEKNPVLIDHVVREALLSYLNRPTPSDVQHLIERLGAVLSLDQKRRVLAGILDVAAAGGTGLVVDRILLRQAMQAWGRDGDLLLWMPVQR